MSKRGEADWKFWERIAAILGARLYGWSYRDHAAFINPTMELTGRVIAEKLIEQEDEIIRLNAAIEAERFNNA